MTDTITPIDATVIDAGDTHTGTVETHSQTSGLMRKVFVPDDWPAGIHVTVVRGHAPEGLIPAGDGTYYGPAKAAAKADYAARTNLDGVSWVSPETFPADAIVQCRPVPDPQPRTELVPWGDALADKRRDPDSGGRLYGEPWRDGVSHRVRIKREGADTCVEADADGMVEVLAEDDPADTDTDSVTFTGPTMVEEATAWLSGDRVLHTTYCGLDTDHPGPCRPVSSGRVPTEGDDTTGPWPPDEGWIEDPNGLAWLFHGVGHVLAADRLQEMWPYASEDNVKAAIAALVALVRDAQPLPDAEQVGDWANLRYQDAQKALDAVAAIRQADTGAVR